MTTEQATQLVMAIGTTATAIGVAIVGVLSALGRKRADKQAKRQEYKTDTAIQQNERIEAKTNAVHSATGQITTALKENTALTEKVAKKVTDLKKEGA